ncbi:MAG: DUF6798 domain-containing protein [Microcoleaceae cyanobacterium]
MRVLDRTRNSLVTFSLEGFAIFFLICLSKLLEKNLAENEIDVLPLAKQFIDSSWIPTDWYLSQPPGYRVLFQFIFGQLIVRLGFLATSIIGRLLCYGLVAFGLVLIGRKLGLKIHWLLLSTTLFLFLQDYRRLFDSLFLKIGVDGAQWLVAICAAIAFILIIFHRKFSLEDPKIPFAIFGLCLLLIGNNRSYSVVANEWLIGGIEAKAIAYGFVVVAIGLMLRQRYFIMAFLLGIATSFHVLVGGYAFLTIILGFIIRWKAHFNTVHLNTFHQLGIILGSYLLGSIFAIQPVLAQLLTPTPAGELSPSYIYVFLRLPHHLNPLVWPSRWWINLIIYLAILIGSILILHLNPASELASTAAVEHHDAQVTLFQLTLISLIPFLIGLIIAPFDAEGKLLQYYPFRFGDVMLPLNTYLLFACTLQSVFATKTRWIGSILPLFLVGVALNTWMPNFYRSALELRQFPSAEQGVTSGGKELCFWIKGNISGDSRVVTSPGDLQYFTWLSERATIAKFKLFPQTKGGILEWHERLNNLSGGSSAWASISTQQGTSVFTDVAQQLRQDYHQLTTAQAIALMNQYQADYFLANSDRSLDLPIVFQNQSYRLYRKN